MPDILKNAIFNINEIFFSIQGEGTRAGLPCVFIRFQGCMLRCSWCDTPYALEIKQIEKQMSANEIVEAIKKYDCNLICLTGGEPLFQKASKEFASYLCDSGFTVTIETSGNIDLADLDKRAVKIIDMKAPSSGMTKSNNYANLGTANSQDEVKFVIAGLEDYEWARKIVKQYNLENKCNVLFSPVYGSIELRDLAEWILKDNLNVRYQLQLHKYIWDPSTRGV